MIFNHSEKDYQDLQKTNWKNIEYLNGKIEQLEKENAELKSKFENNYILPKFDKHKRCNCSVCRYVRGVEKLLGKTEYHKYSKLLETIEGDYELANIENLEELDIQNYQLKQENEKLKQQISDK